MQTALHNLQLIDNGSISVGKAILLENGKIAAVINEADLPAGIPKTDLQNNYVAPGLLDLQIYGSGGKLFGGKPEVAALQQMEQDHLRQGTVGFFATIATNADEIVEQGIAAAKAYRSQSNGIFMGLHLEGPFLNPKKLGAHPGEFIQKATVEKVMRWIDSSDGEIKMITIAPELQDREVIDYLQGAGVIISSGHSNATYAEGKSFLNNPIPAVTHLFNAMPQMHHREPGYIPAIFEERPYTSIVADGMHVDFAMIRLAKRELGDKLFLITDAVTETNEGIYKHRLVDGKYVMPDGTLSGSNLTMLKAVQNCVEQADIDLAEAVNMASLYPAQLTSLNKGRIAEGYDADLIIFNDTFGVVATCLAGTLYQF